MPRLANVVNVLAIRQVKQGTETTGFRIGFTFFNMLALDLIITNPTPKFKKNVFPGLSQIRSIRSVFGWNRTGTGSEKMTGSTGTGTGISGHTLLKLKLYESG